MSIALTHADAPAHPRPAQLSAQPVLKRSVVLDGRKTSVSVEDIFWTHLRLVARERRITLGILIAQINATANGANLSSKIRVFVLRACVTALRQARARLPREDADRGEPWSR